MIEKLIQLITNNKNELFVGITIAIVVSVLTVIGFFIKKYFSSIISFLFKKKEKTTQLNSDNSFEESKNSDNSFEESKNSGNSFKGSKNSGNSFKGSKNSGNSFKGSKNSGNSFRGAEFR